MTVPATGYAASRPRSRPRALRPALLVLSAGALCLAGASSAAAAAAAAGPTGTPATGGEPTGAAGGASAAPGSVRLAAVMGPGALAISVPDSLVLLPSPAPGPGGARLVSTGRLQPITVTDDRSGDPGWTLSGEILGAVPGSTGFDGEYLGWTPGLLGESPSEAIVLGMAVSPGPGTGPGPVGLGQPQVLAIADPGAGLGTVQVTAALKLALPTGVKAGRYSVTLTLTAI